jgi:hypothetical protein
VEGGGDARRYCLPRTEVIHLDAERVYAATAAVATAAAMMRMEQGSRQFSLKRHACKAMRDQFDTVDKYVGAVVGRIEA